MPIPFPFPLTPKLKKIQKLVRDPLASIRKWCYDKKKTITTDPVKRKKKVTKELKLNGNNLQKVVTLVSNKVDEIIDHLDDLAILEKMIIAEVKQRQEEDVRLKREQVQGDDKEREYIKLQFKKLETKINLEKQNREQAEERRGLREVLNPGDENSAFMEGSEFNSDFTRY